MSTYTDLETTGRSPRSRKLQAMAEDARARLEVAREKGLDLAHTSSARAAEYARTAADHARRKPVSTGLIALVAGIGLVFLLSRSARSAAVSVGEDLWGRYGRR